MQGYKLRGKFPPPKKVRVREKGQFTIPAEFRKKININEDDILDVYQVGKAIIATPANLMVKDLARQVEQEMHKGDYSLAELLSELREGTHEDSEED